MSNEGVDNSIEEIISDSELDRPLNSNALTNQSSMPMHIT